MFVSSITAATVRSSGRLLLGRYGVQRAANTNLRYLSSEAPKPKGGGGGSSNLIWQVGIGVGAIGAYIGANAFINKTKESVDEGGELIPAEDKPGTGIPSSIAEFCKTCNSD